MKNRKKAYTRPKLTVHGALARITRSGTVPNADLPEGNNNSANAPRS